MLDDELMALFDELYDKMRELNDDGRMEYSAYSELYDRIEQIEHACEQRYLQ